MLQGKKKPLTPEELELVEECWYEYDSHYTVLTLSML